MENNNDTFLSSRIAQKHIFIADRRDILNKICRIEHIKGTTFNVFERNESECKIL